MCGRFALFDKSKLEAKYGVKVGPSLELPDRYNVAPRSNVLLVTAEGIELMNWGYLPFYEKDPVKGRRLINAKAESVGEKSLYKQSLLERRCVIPANGFYEWKETPEGKIPYYFFPKDNALFSLAGIFEVRPDAEGKDYKTFAIITTEPNLMMGEVHDRMPVILSRDEEDGWLNPDIVEVERLMPLLHRYPDELMASYVVSPLVGNTRNDNPELIQPRPDFG
jgi:putative SOS response-associated peptidase YedK